MTAGTVRAALGRDVDVRARLRRDVPRILYVAAWVVGAMVTTYTILHADPVYPIGMDSHDYWIAWHRAAIYTTGPTTRDGYLYSPAFAEAVWPLAQSPLWAFMVLFAAVNLALLLWLLRPLGWRWVFPLLLVAFPEIIGGNVFTVMAVACVLGFRYQGAWAFALLTKVTPGLGPVWFLVRREWRSLAISVGVTLAVVAVSVVINPGLWVEWVRFLVANSASAGRATAPFFPPFWLRAPIGLGLVVWGARRGKRWTLPTAMLLCTPVIWLGACVLLAAIPRAVRR